MSAAVKNIVRVARDKVLKSETLRSDLEGYCLAFVTRGSDPLSIMEFHGVIDDTFDFQGDEPGSQWTLLKFGGNGNLVHYIPC